MKTLMAVVLAAALAGCGAKATSAARGSANEIDRAEIEATKGVTTAQDLVQRLRPQWLRSRGSATISNTQQEAIVVYVDGVRSGEIPIAQTLERDRGAAPNPLDAILAARVQRLIYYGGTDATQRFGTGHGHGAIEVITR